jgi:hypothetical protein
LYLALSMPSRLQTPESVMRDAGLSERKSLGTINLATHVTIMVF